MLLKYIKSYFKKNKSEPLIPSDCIATQSPFDGLPVEAIEAIKEAEKREILAFYNRDADIKECLQHSQEIIVKCETLLKEIKEGKCVTKQ